MTTVAAWIDTGFNGYLVMPSQLIDQIGLTKEAATDAVLADGTSVVLESYSCLIEWFGDRYRVQVVANSGSTTLLGTALLGGRRLFIDYEDGRLELN